jgi:hypothetical protein
MYIDKNSHIALWLTMIQSQQSLTLRWRSFARSGRERFAFSFSSKGGQYFMLDCLQPVAPQITQATRPTIVDTLLTLIIKMGWEGCRNLFYL